MKVSYIGEFAVATDQEAFRIFPLGPDGKPRPVTIMRTFIYVRCLKSNALTTFKRYLHQGAWHWRDSRDAKPTVEREVVTELSRMLFGGDRTRAEDFILNAIMGA